VILPLYGFLRMNLFKYGEIVEKHFGGVSIEQLEFCLYSITHRK